MVLAALARVVTETLGSLQKAAILNKHMSGLTALVRIRVTTSHHVLKCWGGVVLTALVCIHHGNTVGGGRRGGTRMFARRQ